MPSLQFEDSIVLTLCNPIGVHLVTRTILTSDSFKIVLSILSGLGGQLLTTWCGVLVVPFLGPYCRLWSLAIFAQVGYVFFWRSAHPTPSVFKPDTTSVSHIRKWPLAGPFD